MTLDLGPSLPWLSNHGKLAKHKSIYNNADFHKLTGNQDTTHEVIDFCLRIDNINSSPYPCTMFYQFLVCQHNCTDLVKLLYGFVKLNEGQNSKKVM